MYLTSLLWIRENANDSMGSDFIHLFAWKEPSVGDLYLIQLPLSIMLPLLLISSTWESHTCSLMQTPPCVLSNTLFITWVGWRRCPRQYFQQKGPLHNHQVIQWMSHLACPYQVVAGLSPCFPLSNVQSVDRCAMYVSSASYINVVYSVSRKHHVYNL